jgi:hypothetical protein
MTADMGQQIWSLVGKVVTAGGGGAVVAYAIFRFLGKGWIEHQFAKELEAAKSEISILAARKLKLHDREFVVFPELWSKLNKVFVSLNQAVVSLRQVPDFQRMEATDLDSWVSRSDLLDHEKTYFNSEGDKGRAYGRILDLRDLNKAKGDFYEFHTYLQENRIFLSPEVKGKLSGIDNFMRESLVAKEIDWQGIGRGTGKNYLIEALDTLDKQVKPLMGEIEFLVQARLFPESHKGNTAGAKQ